MALSVNWPRKKEVSGLDAKELPPSRRRTLRRFVRRWWCCGACLVFLIILLPIIFMVIIPAVARRMVDGASLPPFSANLTDPDATSFAVSMDAEFPIPGKFSVKLLDTPLQLYLPEHSRGKNDLNPYLNFTLPEQNLKGHAHLVTPNQRATVVNQTDFVNLMRSATSSQTYRVSAFGKTAVKVGALKIPITINKTVEFNGIGGLNDYTVDALRVRFPTDNDPTNLIANATIRNPTNFTVHVGNITLDFVLSNVNIGSGTVFDMILAPGPNHLAMMGVVDVGSTIGNLTTLIRDQFFNLLGGNVSFTAVLKTATYKGVHLPYFEEYFQSRNVSGSFPIRDLLSKFFTLQPG